MSAFGGDLNRSTQHFILKGKDGVSGGKPRISSRFYCGREDGVVGPLAAGRVAESDWPGVWQALIVRLFPGGATRWDPPCATASVAQPKVDIAILFRSELLKRYDSASGVGPGM